MTFRGDRAQHRHGDRMGSEGEGLRANRFTPHPSPFILNPFASCSPPSTSRVQCCSDRLIQTSPGLIAIMKSFATMAREAISKQRGSFPGRFAGATGVDRRRDARDEPANRPCGDGPVVRHSGAQADAGRPLALAEPAGARGALVPDHSVEHLDRVDRSLETERPAAAPERGFAGRLDLRRRAPADR